MSLFSHRASPAAQTTSSASANVSTAASKPIPQTLLLWLTVSILGTALFPIIYLIEGAVRPGYDAWRDTISSLSLGPMGWMQQLNFALCGVFVLLSAYVWRRILSGGVCATWYPILRVVEGLALVAIAIFTQDPLHTAFLIVIMNAMCFGLFVIARRFWGQSQWRGWVMFSVICGLWPMVVMPFFGLALHGHGALSAYAGLFERLATNADTVWSLVLLARLWSRRAVGI